MNNINDFFGLPKNCYINFRVSKRFFTDTQEFDLKREEKSILKEEIDSIYLKYSLKPQLLNIPKFENDDLRYEEIEIFNVRINNENKYNKVCEFIQKYIQYPMIIIVEHGSYIKFNIAIKKINKNDSSKLIIDEMIYTEWINKDDLKEKDISFFKSLDIKNINTNTMLSVYDGYVNCIRSFIASKFKNEFKIKSIEEVSNDIKILNRITSLENKIIDLKNNMKRETNIGTKVEMNVKIKTIEKEIEKIKSKF